MTLDAVLNRKTYHARFSFKSKQYRFSLNTTNKKIADQITAQIERSLERGLFDSLEPHSQGRRILKELVARPGLRPEEVIEELQGNGRRKLLSEAVEEHLANCKTEHSPKNYLNEVRVFGKFVERLKVQYVDEITTEAIEKWRNERVSVVSKATVNREVKMIKRFLRLSEERGYVQKNPASILKSYREPDRPIRFLSDDEIRRLLGAAPPDLQRIVTILLLTGMRYGELCHLEWSDVDFRRKQIIIQPKEGWTTKNLKKRIIPMHPTVYGIIKELEKKGNYLFPDSEGKCAEKGLRNRLYLVFKRARVKADVKALRSTFASNAVMSGMPIFTLAKLLGHSDVKITEKHYAHLAPDYMGNAITMLQPKWEIPQLEIAPR